MTRCSGFSEVGSLEALQFLFASLGPLTLEILSLRGPGHTEKLCVGTPGDIPSGAPSQQPASAANLVSETFWTIGLLKVFRGMQLHPRPAS